MKYALFLCLALLSGCANFKLGSLVYCQSNADCSFSQTSK